MNKRIRYIKDGNGGFVSKNVLKTVSGEELLSVIDPSGKTGKITTTDNRIVLVVATTSPHKTKIALKKALSGLGVNFEIEKRGKNEIDGESTN